MRNVWIGNNLQMLLGVPVCLTQGLFAYSMLYPVTDNVLDALIGPRTINVRSTIDSANACAVTT